VIISHSCGITSPAIRREMRHRAGMEPILGHKTGDGRLERNRLNGPEGDAADAMLAAIVHDCPLLLARFGQAFLR